MLKMRLLLGFLALLLFLYMANLCIGDTGREMVVVFKGDKTEVPYEDDNGNIKKRKPRAFRVPAFVGGVFNDKEFLAVLCDARYNGFSDWSFIEAAAKTSYGDYRKWSAAEIFAKNTRRSKTHSVVGDVTAVMKGDKIYALTPSWDKSEYSWVRHNARAGWNPLMIVGTVTTRAEAEGGGVFIKWEKKTSIKNVLPGTVLGGRASQFIGGVGNGVVTKKGAIVFPIQIANKGRKVAASIMYSNNDGSTWKMGGTTEAGPSEGSVVEWGDGKLLLFTRHDSGFRKAYESDDMGAKWKESLVFSQVWGNQPDRKGPGCQGSAITVPVDGKDVLLFAHPLNKKGKYIRDTLQLWMSDGQRILSVGKISEDGKGERSGYSILAHVGNHLYSVHEINPFGDWDKYDASLEEWDRVLAISSLPHLFGKVNETVRAWRRLDANLESMGVSTEGLVGFLNGGNDDTDWADMYNCVNARVNGATRVPGGFRFDAKPGSGAQWPVKNQGQNQVYRFTKKQFTIAATVTVHATSEAENDSLFGAGAGEDGKALVLGLGYTQDNKWYALHGNGVKIRTKSSLELEKEYHVAITFVNGVGSVYVDGVAIITEQKLTHVSASISHFYMGGIGESSTAKGISSTVKNVMLFNRALNQAAIAGLSTVNKNGKLQEATSKTEQNGKPDDGNHKRERSSSGSTVNPSRGTNIPDESGHSLYVSDTESANGYGSRDDGKSVTFLIAAWVCLVYFVKVLTES